MLQLHAMAHAAVGAGQLSLLHLHAQVGHKCWAGRSSKLYTKEQIILQQAF
jgi:hypothetical protein